MPRFYSQSPEETRAIGKRLGQTMQGGEVILLNGELGAGKTILTKGLAEGLGIVDLITSPTFTILNTYHGRLTLYHFDMYRITDGLEAEETGILDCLADSQGVVVIEWSQNIASILPHHSIHIQIEYEPLTINEQANKAGEVSPHTNVQDEWLKVESLYVGNMERQNRRITLSSAE